MIERPRISSSVSRGTAISRFAVPSSAVLDDILDRWSEWKRMREAPTRVDMFEQRIQELEKKLLRPWPMDVCRHCRERQAFFVRENNHDKGLIQQIWDCLNCQQRDFRYMKPPTKAA